MNLLKVVERPYTRYTIKQPLPNNSMKVNIAYQKPTRASSEMQRRSANRANDKDTLTIWQAKMNEHSSWWQVDLSVRQIKPNARGKSDICQGGSMIRACSLMTTGRYMWHMAITKSVSPKLIQISKQKVKIS